MPVSLRAFLVACKCRALSWFRDLMLPAVCWPLLFPLSAAGVVAAAAAGQGRPLLLGTLLLLCTCACGRCCAVLAPLLLVLHRWGSN